MAAKVVGWDPLNHSKGIGFVAVVFPVELAILVGGCQTSVCQNNVEKLNDWMESCGKKMKKGEKKTAFQI